MNRHLVRFCAEPTKSNWGRVLDSAVPFRADTFHCHAPGALLAVGGLVYVVVRHVGRGGVVEKRLSRFNRAQRRCVKDTITAQALQFYADQVAGDRTRWGKAR